MDETTQHEFAYVAPLPVKASHKTQLPGVVNKGFKKKDKLGNAAFNLLIVGLALGTLTAVLMYGIVGGFITMSEQNYTGLMWIILVILMGLGVYCTVSVPAAFILSLVAIFHQKTPGGEKISRWKSWFVFSWCIISSALAVFFLPQIVETVKLLAPHIR